MSGAAAEYAGRVRHEPVAELQLAQLERLLAAHRAEPPGVRAHGCGEARMDAVADTVLHASAPEAGKGNQKQEPPSAMASTPMSPPMVFTNRLEMASPRPVPPNLRAWLESA